MKKALMAALVAGLMVSNAAAAVVSGTIDKIKTSNDGSVNIVIKQADDSLAKADLDSSDAAALKTMTATALTAKASGLSVDAVVVGGVITTLILK